MASAILINCPTTTAAATTVLSNCSIPTILTNYSISTILDLYYYQIYFTTRSTRSTRLTNLSRSTISTNRYSNQPPLTNYSTTTATATVLTNYYQPSTATEYSTIKSSATRYPTTY